MLALLHFIPVAGLNIWDQISD